MTPKALQSQIVLGEDSKRQFKVDVRNAESLATEMAAFANSEGGTIFDDRIEIISPGHLPNNLTVEKIRTGNSNIRNPILVSYIAKGLLPYHGLGSGIKRALEQWPQIEFADDHDGCLFTVTVTRKPVETLDLVDKNAPKRKDAPRETLFSSKFWDS